MMAICVVDVCIEAMLFQINVAAVGE